MLSNIRELMPFGEFKQHVIPQEVNFASTPEIKSITWVCGFQLTLDD